MWRALGLGLVGFVVGCGVPPPLSIDATFPEPGFGTLLLNISDAQERWFVIDRDNGNAGADALPSLRLDESGSFLLTAHLYRSSPGSLGFQHLGALTVNPEGQRVPVADGAYRLSASYTSSGSWTKIDVPADASYPLSLDFVAVDCPTFNARAVRLDGATEPVAARARRRDGHFVLFTGRYGAGRPGTSLDLRAYDLDPIQRTSVEIQTPTMTGLRARQFQVGAAIEGDDGKLWLTLNGPDGPSGAPPRTVLWTGTLEGGGTITATMSDSQWIRWMEWTDPDPITGKRDLLLLSDYGQLRRFEVASRTTERVIRSGHFSVCFTSQSSDPNYNLTEFCGGIARDGDRGFVVTSPDRRFFRVSGQGTLTATLTVAAPAGALLAAAVSPRGSVRTMSVDQSSAFTHLFELRGSEFVQITGDISDQSPTLIIPSGDDVLYGGLFGYLTKYRVRKASRCESQAGLLGGLIPTAYDPIGPDSWLLTGGSPASPQTFAVVLSR